MEKSLNSYRLTLASQQDLSFKVRVPEWIEVLILGLIEGITEFLPISSTGHMLLAQHWFSKQQSDLFLAVVQSGAVLAVLMVFTTRVKQLLTEWQMPETRSYLGKLVLAFALTVVGGLILKKLHFKLPKDPVPVALATLIGGVIILLIEKGWRRKENAAEVTWLVAAIIGAGQLLAVIFPGLSRSGTTIMLGLALGVRRRPATEFSFLLGIPTLLAAAANEIRETLSAPPPGPEVNWGMLLWGTVIAALTAFISVKWLLRFIQNHTFIGFAWYRIVLGALILLLAWKNIL
jgi:undecaprenyl-diphosphatase